MGKTTLEWSREIDRRLESVVALRRDFHRHPELSFQEHRTAQIIAERLHAAGLEVHTGLGGTTAVVSIACYGLDIRHPRVHVPAFPVSYLPGVDSITESRTVYL
jgi:hypothetical protein